MGGLIPEQPGPSDREQNPNSGHDPFARIDDEVCHGWSITTTCGLCGGVVDISENAIWAPIGDKGTLKIIHPVHAPYVAGLIARMAGY